MKNETNAIKRLTALALCVMMLFAVVASTDVADASATEGEGVMIRVSVDGYEFSLMESVDDDYNIVRIFERERPLTPCEFSVTEARALMYALGKNEHMIAKMSDEELADIATSAFIMAATAFMEEDEHGNVRNVPRDYAIEQAELINALELEQIVQFQLHGVMPVHTQHHGYIQVTHIASQLAHLIDDYIFRASATWLSMPINRNWGSIGSVSQTVALHHVEPLNYTFNRDEFAFGVLVDSRIVMRTPRTEWATNGELSGSAAVFSLPHDIHSGSFGIVINRNFTASSQHRATQRHPGTPFNSRATYSHRTFSFSGTSVSVSSSGPSIGIGFGVGHNNYHSPLLRVNRGNVIVVLGDNCTDN